jgi:hypothetical protein
MTKFQSMLTMLACTTIMLSAHTQAQTTVQPTAAAPVNTAPKVTTDAQAIAPVSATMGVHGMALFGGRDGLFASHLPMFHVPHDYQVILQIQVTDAAIDVAVRNDLERNPSLWTIEPEAFDIALINNKTKPLRHFKATLYRGHFERGGKAVHSQIDVQITSVLRFQKLDVRLRKASSVNYQLVQSGQSAFLVKLIQQRPDFDQILRLKLLDSKPSATQQIALQVKGLTAPKTELINATLRASLVPATVQTNIYFETGDLQ